MITTFHVFCILAHHVYLVLTKSLASVLPNNFIKNVNPLKFKGSKYEIPSNTYYDEECGIKFVPQLFVQRYLSVNEVLHDEKWKGRIRKVVDFGCSEFGFFPYLKRIKGVQEVLEVDVDGEMLKQHYCRVSPLNADYLCPRTEPLTVLVLEGSIAHSDECLKGCDAVVCIELIEHVYPEVLEEIPFTVFGVIKPLVAIFTTPNIEFNVLFKNSKRFRHPDHKFEWNREQFMCWANNIVSRYPDYQVSLNGIGWAPSGTKDVGPCSQMAVFERCTSLSMPDRDSRSLLTDDRVQVLDNKYQLLREQDYPFHEDTRSEKDKFLEKAIYAIHQLAYSESFWEERFAIIPLTRILPFVDEWTTSISELEIILKGDGWKLENQYSGLLAVKYPLDNSCSEFEEDENDDYYSEHPNPENQNVHSENEWDEHKEISDNSWDEGTWDNLEMKWDDTNHCSTCAESIDSSVHLTEISNDVETKENSKQHTTKCTVDFVNDGCIWPSSINGKFEMELSRSPKIVSGVQKEDSNSVTKQVGFNAQLGIQFIEESSNVLSFSKHKTQNTSKISEDFNDKNTQCNNSIAVENLNPDITAFNSGDTPKKKNVVQSYKCSNVPVGCPKSCSSNDLYLNLQPESVGAISDNVKKSENLFESPLAGSLSLEEANDRLADSGYPNSASAQDMDLDLTPEQVDELFTENDSENDDSPDHNFDLVSVSSHGSDSEARQSPQPLPVVVPQPDVLFEEAMNVENGDVANNNRDVEGNNVVVEAHLNEDVGDDRGDDNAGGVVPQNLEDLIPLFAAAEDFDNDNAIELNVVQPFPRWLLNLVGLANGVGIPGREGGQEDIQLQENSDDDIDNDAIIDEGLGEEFHVGSSCCSDSCPSDVGSD